MNISRIIIGSGRRRLSFNIAADAASGKAAAADIKRLLFPTNGGYFSAKRRGDRALTGLPPRAPTKQNGRRHARLPNQHAA